VKSFQQDPAGAEPPTFPVPSVTDAQMLSALRQRERLQEIADLGLTRADTDAILQEVCTEAAQALGLPIGLVTVVLDEAQHFAAQHGLEGWLAEANGTPVEWSFCRFSVATKADFVVQDAEQHRLVQSSPLVTMDGLRCYAGIPLISSRGHALGSFCVAGTETREFSEEDMATLRGFADTALARIEARRVIVDA
jgi:GAF domain-containing protein